MIARTLWLCAVLALTGARGTTQDPPRDELRAEPTAASTESGSPARRGIRRYGDGDYAGAVEAFRLAIEQQPDDAALRYNLSLALWRSGEFTGAEEAIEYYASAPGGGRVDLHRGMLGLIRFGEAQQLRRRAAEAAAPAAPAVPPVPDAAPAAPQDPVPLLEQALAKAERARDEFARAATAPGADAALARDLERALRLVDDLRKELEEAKRRREEQQQQQQDEQKQNEEDKDEKKQDDAEKKEEEKKQEQKQQDEQKPDEQKQEQQQGQQQNQDPQGEPKPEPQPQQGEPKPEPQPQPGEPQPPQEPPQDPQQPGEAKPEPEPAPAPGEDGEPQPRSDAPGEAREERQLSPEEAKRLLDLLRQLDEKMKAFRANARRGRPPVERDW